MSRIIILFTSLFVFSYLMTGLLPGQSNLAFSQSAPPQSGTTMSGGGRSLGNPSSPASQPLKPVEYVDPNGLFVIVSPPGVVMQEPGENGQLRMQSPKGYVVNMQVGPTEQNVTPKQMAQRLEEKYLGPGKPWSSKLGERVISIGGLPAYDALYQGSGTRVRAIIARGRTHDFIFLFIAPPKSFEILETEFEWILENFQPAPAERGVTADHLKQAGRDPKEMDLNNARQGTAVRQAREARPIGGSLRRFNIPEFGFTIDYPIDWTAVRPTQHRLVISGQEGTDAFYATVTVQNVMPSIDGSAGEKVQSVISDLKRELESNTQGIKYFGERPFTYDRSGLQLNGQQFLATYTYDSTRFRKWAMVLPRQHGDVIHIWSYTAPEDRFNSYRVIAENMLKTWTVRPDFISQQ